MNTSATPSVECGQGHASVGTPQIVGNLNCWFHTSKNNACKTLARNLTEALQLQAAGTFQNAGRKILRGPHTSVFDFALMRDFPIHESLGLGSL